MNKTFFFLHGPEHVARVWKYKATITTPATHAFVLKNLFGMPTRALEVYHQDNSGPLSTPESDSNVAPHNRIDYITHSIFHRFFNGERLSSLSRRWVTGFVRRLEFLQIGEEWKYMPNIMDFWMPSLTASLNEALAGPVLEQVNPNFIQDLLEYMPYVHDLSNGFPRLLCRRGYALRESLLQDVKQWHQIARSGFRETDVHGDGDADPWWGSEIVRERQKMLRKVEHWDNDSIASSDFGLVWG